MLAHARLLYEQLPAVDETLKAFIAAVIGGFGSIAGALILVPLLGRKSRRYTLERT